MKVLHVSGARSWGGNEQQLLYLVEQLNLYKVEQSLFCYENTPLFNRLKDIKINIIAIPYIKSTKSGYQKLLKKAVVDYQFDLLHLHTSDSVTGYVITDLLFKLKTKTVFSKKGIGSKVSLLSKYKYNYKNIHKILCVSEVVYTYFKEVLSKKNHAKLCVVYDGVRVNDTLENSSIDIREELNLPKNTNVIGNIANHTKAKDLKTLVKTLDVLVHKKNIKNIHLIQVGEFSKRTQGLKNLILEYNLENYISFIGFRENASLFLPQFDVFLMTSEREGGPTTVLEAMYKKTPIVSTEVGIVGEAIRDGENGFIAPVGDYQSLANKLETLLGNKSLMTSFSEISYQKFSSSYTVKKLGESTFTTYKEVINEG